MTVTGCCGHFVWTQSCCLRTVHIVQTIHAILKYCELSMQWQPCCCNYWQWVTISLQHTSHWNGWESVLSVPGNQQVTCMDILECSVYLGMSQTGRTFPTKLEKEQWSALQIARYTSTKAQILSDALCMWWSKGRPPVLFLQWSKELALDVLGYWL